jgi:hypothetical protein
MNEYPISTACPQCRGTQYARRKPDRWVAFVSDRVCRACGTRYTPPTPVWAAVLFLLSGLTLPFLGLVLTTLLVHPFSFAGLICEGAIAALGVVVFIGGIRELVNSERARARRSLGQGHERPSRPVLPGSGGPESSRPEDDRFSPSTSR